MLTNEQIRQDHLDALKYGVMKDLRPIQSCPHRSDNSYIIPGDWISCGCGRVELHTCSLYDECVTLFPISKAGTDSLIELDARNATTGKRAFDRIGPQYKGRVCFGCSKTPPSRKPRIIREKSYRYAWRWITTEQFMADLRILAQEIPWPIRGIAGLARGGMLAASWLACYLNTPLYALSDNGLALLPSSGRRLQESNYREGPLVVVEDDTFSGITLNNLLQRYSKVLGDVFTAAVYTWNHSYHPVDLCMRSYPTTWMCEWRFVNGGHWVKDRLATDFDGILCDDCPVEDDDDGPRYLNFLTNTKPKMVIRPEPIPLIVTATREAYRQVRDGWLSRHGMSYLKMVMGDYTLKERTLGKVIDLKANAFGESNCTWFIESCPHQAKMISDKVPKPVICPATGQVFNPDKLVDIKHKDT